MSEENEAVLIGAARDERQDPDQIGRAQGAGKTHQVRSASYSTYSASSLHYIFSASLWVFDKTIRSNNAWWAYTK